MDRVELRNASLFSQDENHRVVAETAARVDGDGGGLVDHEHFTVVHQDLQGPANYGGLVAMHRVLHVVIVLRMGKTVVVN